MSDWSSRGEPIGMSDAEIQGLLDPYIIERFPLTDAAWRDRMQDLSRSLRHARRRQWLAKMLGRAAARTRTSVRQGYDRIWSKRAATTPFLEQEDATTLAFWREQGFVLHPNGIKRVHQLALFRAIARCAPQSILEVGCGAGHHLLPLACRFPQAKVVGLDLSFEGLARARTLCDGEKLPQTFADFSPEPLSDLSAQRRVLLVQGDATKLPFGDSSFDLVYTSLALEQMDPVRELVFAEIARVARCHAVLCEPWRDFNEVGVQRDYVAVKGYFQARSRDLEGFGFRVRSMSGDMPAKAQMRVSVVVADRR